MADDPKTKPHPDAGKVYLPGDVCLRQDHDHGPFPVAVVKDDGSLGYGIGRGMKEGEPILGDHIAVRGDDGEFHTIKLSTGPSQVATKAYRDGWDRTFSVN